MVLWSITAKTTLHIEFTVSWEEGVEAAHECKQLRYTDIVVEV